MSRQYNEAMEGRFELYGTEYRLVEPENIEELVTALEVKSALETYISSLMHDEDSSSCETFLQEQEDYIKEYLETIGDFDNSCLIGNITYFLKKYNIRMRDLEQLIGVSAGYISRTAKENATKKLSIDVVWKLARLFDTDIRTLTEIDLMVPRSNAKLVAEFLNKLCKQTASNEIKWENRGGAMFGLDEAIINTKLFKEEEDGTVVYLPKDHMNPKYKFVLTDDIYTCSQITPDKELAIIGFSVADKEESCFLDFVFLSKATVGSRKGYIAQKAFYSSDDRLGIIEGKAAELMHLVQAQEMDAELSPEVRNIIANYLK